MTHTENTLNLNDKDYPQQVLSYYLWGQATPPKATDIVDGKWIRPKNSSTTIAVDATQYMEHMKDHIPLAYPGVFQKFFENRKDNGNSFGIKEILAAKGLDSISQHIKQISLTHQELVDLIYIKSTDNYGIALKAELPFPQYYINTTSEDYWKRGFVFGSTRLQLDTSRIKYVFDAQTGEPLRLEDIYLQPLADNFDFNSNDGAASDINILLKQIMDPSNIGRKVELEFINNQFFKFKDGIFTSIDFEEFKKNHHNEDNRIELEGMNYWKYKEGLKIMNHSGIYDFTDTNDRLVIFGSSNGDLLKEYITLQEYKQGSFLMLADI